MLTVSPRIATKLTPLMGRISRQMSALSGPPQVRISPIEKAVHGALIAIGLTAIPAWVLINIKNYKAHD